MTYFEKNETLICTCGDQKLRAEIFCPSCENHWASMIGEKNLPFKNSNGSVKWMNAMLNDFFPEEAEAWASGAIG